VIVGDFTFRRVLEKRCLARSERQETRRGSRSLTTGRSPAGRTRKRSIAQGTTKERQVASKGGAILVQTALKVGFLYQYAGLQNV